MLLAEFSNKRNAFVFMWRSTWAGTVVPYWHDWKQLHELNEYEWVQNDVVFSQASWNGDPKWLIYEWQCIAQWKHVSLHLFYTLLYIVFICIVHECNSVWKYLKLIYSQMSEHLHTFKCLWWHNNLSFHIKLIFIFRVDISSFHS